MQEADVCGDGRNTREGDGRHAKVTGAALRQPAGAHEAGAWLPTSGFCQRIAYILRRKRTDF
jgi:hypothetical protein